MMQTNKQFSPFELMGRVYSAAKHKGLDREREGLTRVARLLEETPQTIKNWEIRGPSSAGLLKIQQVLGISATWVLYDTGPMLTDGTAQTQTTSGAAELIAPWPFTEIDFARWAALPERIKGRIETKLEMLIAQAEAELGASCDSGTELDMAASWAALEARKKQEFLEKHSGKSSAEADKANRSAA